MSEESLPPLREKRTPSLEKIHKILYRRLSQLFSLEQKESYDFLGAVVCFRINFLCLGSLFVIVLKLSSWPETIITDRTPGGGVGRSQRAGF